MVTKSRLKKLGDYTTAQRAAEAIERDLVSAMSARAESGRALAEATARGDAIAAEGLKAQLDTLDARAAKARAALDRSRADAHAARTAALGDTAGFDLLGRHPLLLLPVRLEARFAWMNTGSVTFEKSPALEHVLLVRVYPDEIHEDAHDPELSPREIEALVEFRKKLDVVRDLKPLREAWIALAARVGPTRAAWIGELATSRRRPDRRAAGFSRPPVARLLPDRWMAFADLADGSRLSALSKPVADPIELGYSAAGTEWLTSFAAAEKIGMALVVRNLPADADYVQSLRVIGVRGSATPVDAQSALEDLLRAHQFTRGLAFLPPGTPTNSLPGDRTPYTSRPTADDVADVNAGRFLIGGASRPLCQPGDGTDGSAVAEALGIDTATFAFVRRADGRDQEAARALRFLLSAASERSLVRHFSYVADAGTIGDILGYGVARVSALGPLPAIRVGSQPYGILPVVRRDVTRMAEGSEARRFLPALDRLRAFWDTASEAVDRVGKPGADPGQTLLRILQQDGVAQRIAFRPFLGPDAARAAGAALTAREVAVRDARQDAVIALLDRLLLGNLRQSGLVQALHMPFAPPLAVPTIEPKHVPAASAQRAGNYLELVASLGVDKLTKHEYPDGQPLALLFAIARLALLEQADTRARELLENAGADPSHWDDENVPSLYVDPYASIERRLDANDPLDPIEQIWFHLSEAGRDAYWLAPVRAMLRDLKTRPPGLLDELLRATLCLFSSRLDAWYTAIASEQLDLVRQDPTRASGIHIGAYGVLQEIAQAPRSPVAGTPGLFSNPTNGGYIHAPSVNQGAAAAVLRSVHLAHSAAGHGEAFSVDLSSARVRLALQLTEGIRAGQPLAALLGYQIERDLRVEQLARFIAPLRSIAPLTANTLTPSQLPAESVAATNVVDGLALLALAGYDGERDAAVARLWAAEPSLGTALSTDESAAFSRVLASAQDAVDAVADLALAESVYQTVHGNPARTGAAVDSLSGAPVPPADFSILRTPRSGIGVTHRVLVLLGSSGADTSGWADTPRTLAEPHLASWARSILPRPAQIRLRARFLTARRAEAAAVEASLADLLAAAPAELLIGALDVVALASPDETPQRSALETRLLALIDALRPDDPAIAAVELVFDRGDDWDADVFSIVETLDIANTIRDLLGRARPLSSTDFGAAGRTSDVVANVAELSVRADDAASALEGVRTLLTAAIGQGPADIRRALFRADAMGIAGAAPASLRDPAGDDEQAIDLGHLLAQATAAIAEIGRRQNTLADPALTDPSARVSTLFGPNFMVLPALIPAEQIAELFQTAPDGADEPSVRAWLARAARVRKNIGQLEDVLSAADAVEAVADAPSPRTACRVAQLGGVPGERWAALPLVKGTQLPGGRMSLVALTPGAGLPVGEMSGLFIDEWVEVVPNAEETTSVAFHYDAPTSAPPQVMLLGVPYPTQETWTPDDVLEIVDEALALAKIRLVDADAIPELGQILPALVTAENSAGDVAGLDIESLTRSGGP